MRIIKLLPKQAEQYYKLIQDIKHLQKELEAAHKRLEPLLGVITYTPDYPYTLKIMADKYEEVKELLKSRGYQTEE